MKKNCISCGKSLETNIFGAVKDGQEIWGHEIVCNDCCDVVGIPRGVKGSFIAASYTKKRFLKEYIEAKPEAKKIIPKGMYEQGAKEKTELEFICKRCNEKWYVDDIDVIKNIYNSTTSALSLSMTKDYKKCPKCGSHATTHKSIKYWVDKDGNYIDE